MQRASLLSIVAGIGFLIPAVAQTPPGAHECTANQYRVNESVSHAEIKEQRLANAPTDYVNPGQNGSIRVHGWTNADVLVRACVHTAAGTEAEARGLASQVNIANGPGRIEPSGPSVSEESHWDVSYELWVPVVSNLDLKANNGSIAVSDVKGQTRFHTENGSVHLNGVAGDVDGSTTNGSVNIELAGSGWNGRGLRAETTNGSVHLVIPDNFSAQVEASTVNGKLRVDFPVTLSGEIGRNARFQVGTGGPLVEAKTVNGSVTISRKT